MKCLGKRTTIDQPGFSNRTSYYVIKSLITNWFVIEEERKEQKKQHIRRRNSELFRTSSYNVQRQREYEIYIQRKYIRDKYFVKTSTDTGVQVGTCIYLFFIFFFQRIITVLRFLFFLFFLRCTKYSRFARVVVSRSSARRSTVEG